MDDSGGSSANGAPRFNPVAMLVIVGVGALGTSIRLIQLAKSGDIGTVWVVIIATAAFAVVATVGLLVVRWWTLRPLRAARLVQESTTGGDVFVAWVDKDWPAGWVRPDNALDSTPTPVVVVTDREGMAFSPVNDATHPFLKVPWSQTKSIKVGSVEARRRTFATLAFMLAGNAELQLRVSLPFFKSLRSANVAETEGLADRLEQARDLAS